jgi:hypothetical protein
MCRGLGFVNYEICRSEMSNVGLLSKLRCAECDTEGRFGGMRRLCACLPEDSVGQARLTRGNRQAPRARFFSGSTNGGCSETCIVLETAYTGILAFSQSGRHLSQAE